MADRWPHPDCNHARGVCVCGHPEVTLVLPGTDAALDRLLEVAAEEGIRRGYTGTALEDVLERAAESLSVQRIREGK